MPKKPDERIIQAKELFDSGMKLVEIASQLNLPEGTIRSWKNRNKWDATLQSNKRNVAKKRGGQLGNKNAAGQFENQHARKHGLFAKYLSDDVKKIYQALGKEKLSALDYLWASIEIQQASILQAQKDDLYTIDAQSRAMKTLESMIKRYDEMLNADEASEYQCERINLLKAQVRKLQDNDDGKIEDDGFMDAIKGSAVEDWADD